MSTTEVTMVRVYLTEQESDLTRLLTDLHKNHRVRGATVFRGIAGFGESGVVHTSSLMDLSLDLPLVLEFFDRPDAAAAAMKWMKERVDPSCMVSWSVQIHCELED